MIDNGIALIIATTITAIGGVLSTWIQQRRGFPPNKAPKRMNGMPPDVKRLCDLQYCDVQRFLAARGLVLTLVPQEAEIPGSYWGAPEAGLIGNALYTRLDTPIHSILHTSCHWLCMSDDRRLAAHTNAGGDDIEEVAVCYLQCLLADELPGYSRSQAFADMDLWEYSFRLGSAEAWFRSDAEEAKAWLVERRIATVESDEVIRPAAGRQLLEASPQAS